MHLDGEPEITIRIPQEVLDGIEILRIRINGETRTPVAVTMEEAINMSLSLGLALLLTRKNVISEDLE